MSSRITFHTGLILAPMENSIYATPLWFVSPAIFLICMVKILWFFENYSKVLHRPGTAHTGLLFVSPLKQSDLCSAARTGLQWRIVNKILI